MGNKASRRKADRGGSSSKAADGTAGLTAAHPAGQSSSVDAASDDKKGVSCPDLSAAGSAAAVPYHEEDSAAAYSSGPRHVNYTVYRSYSNVAEAARRSEPRPDIRFLSSFSLRNLSLAVTCGDRKSWTGK